MPLLSEEATFVAINCKCYKFDKIVPNMPPHIQNLLICDTGGYQPSVDVFAFTDRPIAHKLRSLTVASLNWSNVAKAGMPWRLERYQDRLQHLTICSFDQIHGYKQWLINHSLRADFGKRTIELKVRSEKKRKEVEASLQHGDGAHGPAYAGYSLTTKIGEVVWPYSDLPDWSNPGQSLEELGFTRIGSTP